MRPAPRRPCAPAPRPAPCPALRLRPLLPPRPAPAPSRPPRPAMRAAYTTAAVADHAQFVEAVRERRITPSPGELRRRLQELGRKRRAAECELIVEAVRTAGGRLFVEYVNEVIKAHVSAGDAEAALRTFGRIGEYRLEPDVASYTIVVNGLVRQRLLDKADSLLDEMRTKRVHPDGVFFSKLLTAYATIGDVERSIKTLGEVRRTRIIPAHETLCTVLQLFHKHRLFREIGELVTMMDEHYGPTQVTVAARMTVLMKEKRWDEIDELWRKLPSFRVRPNTLIYNILIQAARHRGRPERAIAIYDEMRQARLRPDAHSISLLLNLYAKAGNRERVQELLATPPLSTRPALERTLRLRSVVHGAARGQHVELVQSTLGALRAVNGVDRWTVGVALAAFAQAKMREPAEALLKEFPAFRTQPSVLNSMLFLYANMDLLTEAENLFLSLDRKDSAAFAIMFEMYERLGKPEEARRVREAHQAAFPRQRLDRHRPGEPDEPAHMGQPFEREI